MDRLDRLKLACSIADEVFFGVVRNFRQFKTEKGVAKFIETELVKRNSKPSFKIIVASGANGADPHHCASQDRLKKGFCVIDFGARIKGIASDLTRTVFLGKPSNKERLFYNLVLRAQKKAIAGIKPGMLCCQADALARNSFGKYREFFVHRLGHGLGRKVHSFPSIGRKSRAKLREGMVFTVEPGLYFKGKFGIRIEDDVLLSKNRCKRLTKGGRKLIVLPWK